MVELDEVTRLKAIVEVYKRHHAQCYAISAASHESVDRELLVLSATILPGQIESPSHSQHQEKTYSTLERPITSNTEAGGSALAITESASELQQDGFKIVEFNPLDCSKTSRISVNRYPPKKKAPAWRGAADLFVAEAPIAQEWNMRVQQLGIEMSTSPYEPIERLFKPTQQHAESTIISRAKYHAQQAADFIKGASRVLANARMYLLCVLSYFCMLDTLGLVETDIIHDMMAQVVGSRKCHSDKYRKRIWDGAGWMNKELMSCLVEAGWTWAQATTLCLFCTCLLRFRLIVACLHQREAHLIVHISMWPSITLTAWLT
jgi:hypothetical protein